MAATVEQSAISVSDLTVGFGKKIVLDHLSLEVRRGEILGLVGASGGGKSVLLRTIIGLIPKRQGHIEIMGMELDKADPQEIRTIGRRWGILFQQGALFSSLTVRQNVQFPMRENLEISRFAARRTGDRPSWKWSGFRGTTATSFLPSCPAA